MAMLKMEAGFAGYPQSCTVAGAVVPNNSSAATANTIIQPGTLAVTPNVNGAQPGALNNILPLTSKVPAVIFPTTAYKPQVAANANSNTFLMLDFSGFPGNLVSVQLQLRTNSSPSTGNASIANNSALLLDFDQVNKLVYVGVINSSGAYQAWTSQYQLMYNATFIDSAFP
jgi:hypothetical protein